MLAALVLAAASGCAWIFPRSNTPAGLPALPAGPSPEAMTSLDRGRTLFDQRRYREAREAFTRAAADPPLALDAQAFVLRIDVILGAARADTWVVDARRAADPEMMARIRVEVRWLLNEARQLVDQGRHEEAVNRLRRAGLLIEQAAQSVK